MRARSFSAAARDEAARAAAAGAARGARAELAGLMHAAGSVHVRGGRAYVELRSERAAVARRAYGLVRRAGLPAEIWARRRRRPRPGNEYLVRVGDAQRLLRRLQRPLAPGPASARALLRGLFLGAGSVADPMAGHHLEIVLTDRALAEAAVAAAARCGLALRSGRRRGAVVLYLKDAGAIAELLRLVGAPAASFAYEDARILRDVRGRVNRLVNADNANLNKAVQAAVQQAEAIRRLAAGGRLARLPAPLRQVADLRLRHPDLSLRELGALLQPPLGKSGVNHRLRRLLALAGSECRKHWNPGERSAPD